MIHFAESQVDTASAQTPDCREWTVVPTGVKGDSGKQAGGRAGYRGAVTR